MENEKRLIDADKIYDEVERRYQISSGTEHRCERDLLDLICAADTVDAVEVVHGYWIEKQKPISWCEDDVDVFTVCSICGCHSVGESNYCPNCGAKMDGGEN